MAQPRVLLSALIDEPRGARFPFYTEVLLNQKPVLGPGESVEVVTSVDVGALRDELIQGAAAQRGIELSAVLDPIRSGTTFVPGLASVYAPAIRATIPAVSTDAAGLAGLVSRAGSPDVGTRIETARDLGALETARRRRIVGFEHGDAMDAAGTRAALLQLARDDDWTVRAAALDALSWSIVSPDETRELLAANLACPQPAPRYGAMILAARFERPPFQRVVRELAARDPSSAVRLQARGFIGVAPPASSQPSDASR
jgi:hypothetical protein